VLRIGTERLLTLTHDPRCGIICWDENALAEARRYQQLSPVVGLIVLRSAAQAWVTAAAAAPADIQVRHPQFGTLGALEIIRRNAHEVHHHLMDIKRADTPREHLGATARAPIGLPFTGERTSTPHRDRHHPHVIRLAARNLRPLTTSHHAAPGRRPQAKWPRNPGRPAPATTQGLATLTEPPQVSALPVARIP